MKLWTTIILVILTVFSVTALIAGLSYAQGEELQPGFMMPGRIEGTGTYFEITDSEYLNVSLESNKEITVALESVPNTISLIIEAPPVASSTELTISGLKPNTTYYKYEDSYKNEVRVESDYSGNYSWTQDFSQPHHIWFQPRKGTIFLPEDCSVYGTWDIVTKTCVLNQNITQSVEITENNMALNCNGHNITGTNTGFGIYLNQRIGTAIQKCTVGNFSYGIYFSFSSNNTIINSSILDNFIGIVFSYSSVNTMAYSILKNNRDGINLSWGSDSNTLTDNVISSNRRYGVIIAPPDSNTVTNNTISNNYHGIYLWASNNNTLANNTFNWNTGYGIWLANSSSNIIDNNISSNNGGDGIFFQGWCDNNLVTNNSFSLNGLHGIFLANSSNNRFVGNTMSGNRYNFRVLSGFVALSHFIHDIDTSNKVNGKSMQYLVNKQGKTIDSSWDVGYLGLINSTDIIVKDLTLTNNGEGILLAGSSNIKIENNTFSNNLYGIYLYSSSNNKVYHNNFIDNSLHQAFDYKGTNNLFDNSLPDGGNYWSDYDTTQEGCTDANNDKICDSPYTFTGGQDRYPWTIQDGWRVPVNQLPSLSSQNQYKSDSIIPISENSTTTESTVVFKATLSDPDNDQIKLQIELKEFNQSLDETDLIESDFVPSEAVASITRYGLISGQYHWRARAVDARGAISDWQEFGEIGNVDFEVKLVPLYTQVRSPYPSFSETEHWAVQEYGTGDYLDCLDPQLGFSSIRRCGCAITSMVMLGRYYDVDTAIDNSDTNPENINSWLTNNNGYTPDGSLWWGKAIEYLGYIDEISGKKMVRFDFSPRTDYNVPFSTPGIDDFLDFAKPIVVNSKTFGHYFVVDGKLTSTYTLKDPNWYNTQRLNQAKNLAQHIQGYNNYFDTANLFTYLDQPKSLTASLYIYLASPAELLVTDPLGRKIGKDPITDTVYDEIPDGIYTSESPIVTSDVPLAPEEIRESKVIYIASPIDGKYNTQVIGTDTGTYVLNTLIYDQNGESEAVVQEGSTIPDNIQQFELDYSLKTIQQSDIYRIVNIDIQPGSYPNSINLKSKGVIPVAVLTDEFFDAKNIIIDSIIFAGVSPTKGKLEDIDNDGDLDLMLHFKTQSLQLTPISTEAVLIGQLTTGVFIRGIDSVRILANHKSQNSAFLAFLGAPGSLYQKIKTLVRELISTVKETWISLSNYFAWRSNELKEIVHGLCLENNEYVDYKINENKDSSSNAIVYIKEKDTDKTVSEFQIDNIVPNHYRPYEAHKCGVYTVREFNYDYIKKKVMPDFRMEVWRYRYDGSGEKIIQRNDFRVDPNEKYISIEYSYLGQDDYALTIKDLESMEDVFVLKLKDVLIKYPDVIPGSFDLGRWSDDGRYLYGDIFQGALSTAYYIIDTGTWKVDVYAAPPDILSGVERRINFDNLHLAYVDIPTFVELQEVYEQIIKQAKEEGRQKNLYVYNLRTRERVKIASADPEWRFNIKWLSDTELEYELPSGEKKIYKINE